jgi:hypothetical protein
MVVSMYDDVHDKYEIIRTETSSFMVTNLTHTQKLLWNWAYANKHHIDLRNLKIINL